MHWLGLGVGISPAPRRWIPRWIPIQEPANRQAPGPQS